MTTCRRIRYYTKAIGQACFPAIAFNARPPLGSRASDWSLKSVLSHSLSRAFSFTKNMNENARTKSLVDQISALNAKTDINPVDPRYWKTHFQPFVSDSLQLASQARQAGVGDQAIPLLVRMATYLGIAEDFERAIEAGTLATEIALEVHGKDSEPYAAALVPLAYAVGSHDAQAKAMKQLKTSLRIREKLHKRASLPVAETLYHLGGLAREALEIENSFDYLERCYEIRQALLPEDHLDLAAALDAFGLAHYYLHREEGLEYVEKAFKIRERLLPDDHPWIAESINNCALFYELIEADFDKEAMYRRCLAISEKWYGPAHSEIATHAENLAILLQDQGEFEEAETLFRRVVDMNYSMHGQDAEGLPLHISCLVDCLIHQNNQEEATLWIERGVQLLTQQAESESKRYLLCNFANHYSALGLETEAVDLYRRVISKLKATRDPSFLVTILDNLGSSLKALGKHEEAIEAYARAHKTASKEFGPNSQQVAELLLALRALYFEMGDHENEVLLARQYLDTAKKLHRKSPAELVIAHRTLAASLTHGDLIDEADQQLSEALKIALRELGDEHQLTANLFISLGQFRTFINPDQAVKDLRRGLEIQMKLFGEDADDCYSTLHALGEAEFESGDAANAFITLTRCAAYHFPDQKLPKPKDASAAQNLTEFQDQLVRAIAAVHDALSQKEQAATATAITQLLTLLLNQGSP